MVITFLGVEFVKLQLGDVVVAMNPISKESRFKGPHFAADIVCISLNNPDMNGVEAVTYGSKIPFIINGPGEYEVKGIFIKGFVSESLYAGTGRINTIYALSMDGLSVCFLGSLSSVELPEEILEGLEAIDVLFTPIGGEGVLEPALSYKLSVGLEPKIIIPIHYGLVGKKDSLKSFLKEAGEKGVENFEKITLRRKDLDDKEGDIMVLKPQGSASL